jgi:type IV pilus assembly protein PilM
MTRVEANVEVEPPEPKKRLSRAEKKARRAVDKERRRRGNKAKKIVGLKIGASQLAAARVSNNGSAELLQVARQPLDPGIVVAGELRDPESLATALKAFFKKNKLPTRGVRIGLSNNRIGVRIFEIGGIHEPEQLKNAIRFRAQETLPIPIEEAVLDYHVLDERVDENGDLTRRVLLVVAYRDLIERYVAACRKAGLKLVGVDLEAFALLRALGKSPSEHSSEDRNGLVVVSVGHDRSTFAVSDGRACEFTRVLDWGGFSLNVAIARALDLTPSQSEQIKLGLSLTDKAHVPPGMTAEHADTARAAVLRALEAFARDLVSSLRFYQSQPDSLGIREVVLTGGTAAMPGLASEVERLIGVSVRVGDPLGRVNVSRRVKQDEQVGSLAAAIGLGIED